jgi:hypothetical protein
LENSPSKKKKERIVLPQNSICIVENPTNDLDENTDLWAWIGCFGWNFCGLKWDLTGWKMGGLKSMFWMKNILVGLDIGCLGWNFWGLDWIGCFGWKINGWKWDDPGWK